MDRAKLWPSLPFEEWKETCATLQMWTQIVGKIRLTQTPWVNHSWHVTLYVTARGLTTSPIPHGARTFEIDFDFIDHQLRIETCDGGTRQIALEPKSVAAFYGEVMAALTELGVPVEISRVPNEVDPAIPLIAMKNMRPMMPSMRTASGACSYKLIASSRTFGPALSGSAVQFIFSGAASIWP